MNDLYENFLHDFCLEMREIALDARKKKDKALGTKDELFDYGYLSGFQCTIDTLQQMLTSFNIPLEKFGLDKIDPYEDLV